MDAPSGLLYGDRRAAATSRAPGERGGGGEVVVEYSVASALLLLGGGEPLSVGAMLDCVLYYLFLPLRKEWMFVYHGSGTSQQTSISGEERWDWVRIPSYCTEVIAL